MKRAHSSVRNLSPAEVLETVSPWSDEDQQILDKNLLQFPTDQYSEFKRLALLLTGLNNKKLRDVSLRLQYMKSVEAGEALTWDEFIKKTLSPKSKSERAREKREKENMANSAKTSPRTPKLMTSRRFATMESPVQSPRFVHQFQQQSITIQGSNTPGNKPKPRSKSLKGNGIVGNVVQNQNNVINVEELIKQNEEIITMMNTSVNYNEIYNFKTNCNNILMSTNVVNCLQLPPFSYQIQDIERINVNKGVMPIIINNNSYSPSSSTNGGSGMSMCYSTGSQMTRSQPMSFPQNIEINYSMCQSQPMNYIMSNDNSFIQQNTMDQGTNTINVNVTQHTLKTTPDSLETYSEGFVQSGNIEDDYNNGFTVSPLNSNE